MRWLLVRFLWLLVAALVVGIVKQNPKQSNNNNKQTKAKTSIPRFMLKNV